MENTLTKTPAGGNSKASPTSVPELRVGADCVLANAPAAVTAEIERRLTIANPRYQAAQRYGRWIGKKLKPQLRFYEVEPDGLHFPRGYANQVVRLCRQLTGQAPTLLDQRRLLDPIAPQFTGELRPYQEEAVEVVAARSFGVLEAATGSGKTVMALALIARRRQPALVLVHTRELLHQWRERIRDFLGCEAGCLGDGMADIRPLSVAIVNSARNRLDQLVPRFGHLVVDECHRVPASLFTEVVSTFDSHYMLGLSATAFRREDGLTPLITMYMGDLVHTVDRGDLLRDGAVALPELVRRETRFNYRFSGDYSAMLRALTLDDERNLLIAGDVAETLALPDSGILLLVSDRVEHCETLLELLSAHGIAARLLTGRQTAVERATVVEDLHGDRVRVLVATLQLIGEGFDCPGLTTLFLATPIKFEGRLLQVAGRVMRPAAGKRARVVDYVDVEVPLLRRSAEGRKRVFDQMGTDS